MKHAQGWAEKKVYGLWGKQSLCWSLVARLLKAEHARAIRIVKAEMKRVQLSQYEFGALEKKFIVKSLENVLTALQRGRGGKG